jgi:hypothetical protein
MVVSKVFKASGDMTLWLVGHWHSQNMGDRFQGFAIWSYLVEENGVPFENVLCVNYSECHEPASYRNVTLDTYNLETRLPPDQPAVIVLTTGSMDANSPYVPWLRAQLQAHTTPVIVWGGLSIPGTDWMAQEEWVATMDFLKHPHLTFFARSDMDLQAYRTLVHASNRGRLAGDPMAFYTFPETLAKYHVHEPKLQSRRRTEHAERLQPMCCPSGPAFAQDNTDGFWSRACEEAASLLLIDTVADPQRCPKEVLDRATVVLEPWLFIGHVLTAASSLVTRRLHGAMLAALVGVPTLAIDRQGKRTSKFVFMGESACGRGKGLFVVNGRTPAVCNPVYADEFRRLTRDTFGILHCLTQSSQVLLQRPPHAMPVPVTLCQCRDACLPTTMDAICMCIDRDKGWEPCVFDCATAILNAFPDSWFIDVGAHVGLYTVLAQCLGHPTVAFESVAEHYQGLCASIIRNGNSHTTRAHHMRVGDSGGFRVVDYLPVDATMSRTYVAKIDVNGAEASAVASLLPLLFSEAVLCCIINLCTNNKDIVSTYGTMLQCLDWHGFQIVDVGPSTSGAPSGAHAGLCILHDAQRIPSADFVDFLDRLVAAGASAGAATNTNIVAVHSSVAARIFQTM